MFLDISHQEFDGKNRYHKGYHNTYDQDDQLCGAEGKTEFDQFQKTCSEHNRNCQEKGKFCCNCTGCSCKDSSDNGRSGTGCSRNHGKHLEAADDQRCLKGKLIQSGAGWSAAFVVVLDNDKKHTINDQHDGNDHIVVKFLFNNVIKRKSDDDRRQTCYQDLKPEDPLILITVFFYKSKDSSGYCRLFTQCHLCFLRDFSYVKRPQLVPVQYNNCQDRAKLDHHQEKFHKCLGYIQLDKLIHKDHMSGTTDRKPLGDSLHNTEKDNLQ